MINYFFGWIVYGRDTVRMLWNNYFFSRKKPRRRFFRETNYLSASAENSFLSAGIACLKRLHTLSNLSVLWAETILLLRNFHSTTLNGELSTCLVRNIYVSPLMSLSISEKVYLRQLDHKDEIQVLEGSVSLLVILWREPKESWFICFTLWPMHNRLEDNDQIWHGNPITHGEARTGV